MQPHDGAWRGLAHPSQGWHNLNLLYSYNILKCIKCPKSHAIFLTIINLIIVVFNYFSCLCPFYWLWKRAPEATAKNGMHPLIAGWPLRQFGSGWETRQAPFLKPLTFSFQTSTWGHGTVSYVQDPAAGNCTELTAQELESPLAEFSL